MTLDLNSKRKRFGWLGLAASNGEGWERKKKVLHNGAITAIRHVAVHPKPRYR